MVRVDVRELARRAAHRRPGMNHRPKDFDDRLEVGSRSLAPRKRVLHILTTFSVSSGAAENARLTMKYLPRDRFEVFLGVQPGQSMERHVASDISVLPMPHLVRPIRPWSDAASFFQIYKSCRKWRFDVVHTHNSKDGIVGRWAAHLARVPVIIHTIHNLSFR